MRVVAGSARGRRLRTPPGDGTRPTSDRAREAVFNALVSLGAVDGAAVLDLYAGSGALGIEALSRGASWVGFVERDASALRSIEENLATLGFDQHATIHRGEVATFLSSWSGPGVDLVLADPPYAFDGWADLLGSLLRHLAPGAVVVAESGTPIAVPEGWEKMRERTYGGTVISFVAPPDTAPPACDPDHRPGAEA